MSDNARTHENPSTSVREREPVTPALSDSELMAQLAAIEAQMNPGEAQSIVVTGAQPSTKL